MRRGQRAGRPRRTDWAAYPFVALFTIPFLLFNVLPIGFTFYLSFMRWDIFGTPKFVGFRNYANALSDEYMTIAFQNLIVYVGVIVPAIVVIGLLCALYVHQRWPFYTFARAAFFVPYVVSATVIGLVWVWMLDTRFGIINHYLSYLGLPYIPWLTSIEWSKYGVSLASIWWDLGLAFLLFLAGLQDIPGDLYDAAEVDGASFTQQLRHVTLPQLSTVISAVVTLQLISTLRIFSQVYIMTSGGPASSSSSVLFYIYTVATRNQKFGLAAAVSMLLFAVILVVTLAGRRIVREA
jgi:multiple sugar transport system permease protein